MAEDLDTIEVVRHDQARGNPFVCNICKKSYSRIDHLARHYRSHSQERPFTCSVCNKTFARVDLLKRHAGTHGDASTQIGDSPPKRRRTQTELNRPRAQKACKACAEAKARCEGGSPCLRCLQKRTYCELPPSKANEATARSRTSTSDDPHTRQTSQSLIEGNDDRFSDPELSVPCDRGPASSDGNIVVPDPMSQTVFPLSIPSGSGFGQMINQTELPLTTMSSGGSRHGNLFNTDPTTLPENLISLDFLPLGVNDHTVSFDDLLSNDEFFTNQGLSFGVEFAFNSPTNVDPALISQFRPPQAALSSAVIEDPDPVLTRSGVITSGLRNKLNITASTQAFKESFWRWTPAKQCEKLAS